MKKNALIFCDGGFGNRYNSLVSGLALARALDMNPIIYWPCNNWCQADFKSIFSNNYTIFLDSLTSLKGKVKDFIPLLHDDSASSILDVPFNSAYQYASIEDFKQRDLENTDGIFYYPALIPQWIPVDRIELASLELKFNDSLVAIATKFIQENFGQPFYGIHLRRTDLEIGLSDAEVSLVTKSNLSQLFYVCSDDPMSERIAALNENVRIRRKSSYVSKKNESGTWTSLTLDDDHRPYYSNIERSADSVIDAVVDILILAHATLIGYSGSTFQSVARLIGVANPLIEIQRPANLKVVCLGDCKRKLKSGLCGVNDIINLSQQLVDSGRVDDGIDLLQYSLNFFGNEESFPLFYNLAFFLFSTTERYKEALIFIDKAIQVRRNYVDAYILGAEISKKLN
jgi:hypothetical protein